MYQLLPGVLKGWRPHAVTFTSKESFSVIHHQNFGER
jgi:hypothetical protein